MKDQHQQRINLVNCELCSHWNGMGNCIKKLITAHANNFYITWLQEIAKATQSIISTMMASPTILSSCCLSSTYTFKVSPTENLVLSDSLVVFHWVPSRAEWPLVDEDASHYQWFQVLFHLLICSTLVMFHGLFYGQYQVVNNTPSTSPWFWGNGNYLICTQHWSLHYTLDTYTVNLIWWEGCASSKNEHDVRHYAILWNQHQRNHIQECWMSSLKCQLWWWMLGDTPSF